MNESGTSLQNLRAEIDRIDSEMHKLIQQRAALVDSIRAAKEGDSSGIVRPGREANILRTLFSNHNSGFPFAAVARVWREIIAGITRMEMSDYAIAVLVADNDPSLWDLARNQFGSATPMTAFATTREVLGEVVDGRATLGVLPVPSAGDTDPWWTNINVRDDLRISYRLPFSSNSENAPQALALGRVPPESSGQDRSLIVIEMQEALSRAGVTGLAERVGIKGYPIASCVAGLHFQLLDAEGYIADDDTRIDDLAKLSNVAQAMVIGAYAEPIESGSGAGPAS